MSSVPSSKSVYSLFVADAFTKQPFSGNSAAVCLVPFDKELDDDVKQRIALEMNLSETAFVKIREKKDTFETGNSFDLQWFTPKCQVSLCGHATLASSAVLFKECGNKSDVLEFHTRSGILKAKHLPCKKIQIDLPAFESITVQDKYDKVVKAVVGKTLVEDVVISQSNKLLIRLNDSVERRGLEDIKTNDAELLTAAPHLHGIIVTVRGTGKNCNDADGNRYDFMSRYFAPWMGISEDPVTGSAHSVLAPFWAKVLNQDKFYARQCSSRGGDLHVHLKGERVILSGDAVVVLKGQITF